MKKKTIVIKLGGQVVLPQGNDHLQALAGDLKALLAAGYQLVLVHGGGVLIDKQLKAKGIEPQKKDGLRITDAATMEVVQEVLSGVNTNIATALQSYGLNVVSFAAQNTVLTCTQKSAIDTTGLEFPLGFVGAVSQVDTTAIADTLKVGQIPLLAPLAHCPGFDTLFNVNADNAASMVAEQISSDMLIFMTDVPGVIGADDIGVKTLYKAHSDHLSAIGAVKGGMLPKLHSAFQAAESGVGCIQIIDGTKAGALLASVLEPGSYGTLIAC
jgi:acetylglutamate kinase